MRRTSRYTQTRKPTQKHCAHELTFTRQRNAGRTSGHFSETPPLFLSLVLRCLLCSVSPCFPTRARKSISYHTFHPWERQFQIFFFFTRGILHTWCIAVLLSYKQPVVQCSNCRFRCVLCEYDYRDRKRVVKRPSPRKEIECRWGKQSISPPNSNRRAEPGNWGKGTFGGRWQWLEKISVFFTPVTKGEHRCSACECRDYRLCGVYSFLV